MGGESWALTRAHPLVLCPSSLPNCVDVAVSMRRCVGGGLEATEEVGVARREFAAMGDRDDRRGTILLPMPDSTSARLPGLDLVRASDGEIDDADDNDSLLTGDGRLSLMLSTHALSEAPDVGVFVGEREWPDVIKEAEFRSNGRGPDLGVGFGESDIPRDAVRDCLKDELRADPVSDMGDTSTLVGDNGDWLPVNIILSLGGRKKAGRAGGEYASERSIPGKEVPRRLSFCTFSSES